MSWPRRRFLVVAHKQGFDYIWGRAWTRRGAESRIHRQHFYERDRIARMGKRRDKRTPPGGHAAPLPTPQVTYEVQELPK